MEPRPPWIKTRYKSGPRFSQVKQLLREESLHTVCEEAGCPNIHECFESGTATFLILGDTCTRNCGFCLVNKGKPDEPDPAEPRRVANAVAKMGLKHVVVTSVTRDDLPDGGASAFVEVTLEIKRLSQECAVELLVPDFRGERKSLEAVLAVQPDVLNHNAETVPRLYPLVRPQADYERSLKVLADAKEICAETKTKSGIMVGLGEVFEEVAGTLKDLRRSGCDAVTIGQYLSPTRDHLPVARYYTPEEFEELKTVALEMDFTHVESGSLVRSSYHAAKQLSQ